MILIKKLPSFEKSKEGETFLLQYFCKDTSVGVAVMLDVKIMHKQNIIAVVLKS